MYFPERESTFGFSDLYFYIGKVPADDIENINKEQFMQENEKVYMLQFKRSYAYRYDMYDRLDYR